jgi:2-polyprenyl-6-hydroxyphenyl methylase/3-demethylubiquinone-9 3-methyltransferase
MTMAEGAAAGGSTGTAAADEIARFDALAEAWWDPDGDFRPLHALNPVRMAFIRNALCRHFQRDADADSPFADLDCLDIGCGGGLASEPMARLGARVIGIDASPRAIEAARRHAAQQGLAVEYRWMLPEELEDLETTFDVVLALEVVEHVLDLGAFLAAASQVLKPGGVLVAATLNRTLKSLALAKIGAEYLLRWLPVGTHDWRKFVRPAELARGMRRQGLTLATISGMHYDLASGRWSLGRDLGVNYIAAAVKAPATSA